MGRSIYAISSLLYPLSLVQERYTTIPANQVEVVAGGPLPRVMFYLEGGIMLELPDGTIQVIERGDAVLFSDPPERYYRSHGVRAPSPGVQGLLGGWRAVCRTAAPGTDRPSVFPAGSRTCEGRRRGAVPPPMSSVDCDCFDSRFGRGQRRRLGRCGEARGKATRREPGERLAVHARQFIDEHYHEHLTLSGIAWKVQLSGDHIERLFKRHLGCSVFTYLRRTRIENVKRELLASDLSIWQIATAAVTPRRPCSDATSSRLQE